MTDHPMTRPGEVAGWPKLVIRYETDQAYIDKLLPPGLEPTGEPIVQIGIYCVPVKGEPEYGVSTKVPARYDGVDGQYSLGMGIDQESAIFISRDTNGQPKFPCTVRYFRLGDRIEASATHQGRTFLEYSGTVSGTRDVDGVEHEDNEWWIKVSRGVGGAEHAYDFPPHVVRVQTKGTLTHVETLEGRLQLHPSPWDPYTDLLPVSGAVTAELTTTRFTARNITREGPLDPDAFWPFVDTIGGSRWPGSAGGPRTDG